jgi:cysteine protease ATG4
MLSWFLDRPSPLSPYSLHAIALEGRRLDKPVGAWFGPSTIAAVLACVGACMCRG